MTKSRLNEEVPDHQKGFRFNIQFERHLSLKALKLSKYPVYNPVQGKLIYHEALKLSNPVQNPGSRRIYLLQKVKGCSRGPVALTRGSNISILPYRLIFIWSLGGFLFKHRCVHQTEHSVTTLLIRHTTELTRGLLDRIRIIA